MVNDLMALRLAYLLEETGISGRAATTLAQADALIARGHRVRIVTTGPPLTWRSSQAEWIHAGAFSDYDAREDEFVIATSTSTVEPALALAGGRTVHLCLESPPALEGSQVARLVVSKSTLAAVQRLTTDVACVGAIVDADFFRARTPAEREPPRILLCGHSQDEVKGIHEGYGAVAHARWFHQKIDLIRVSPWVPSRDEPLDSVQEFHVALDRAEMVRLMHSCDALIAPNHAEEGFFLPAAEALAAGIPVLMTSIPSFLSFDDALDYAAFAPAENAVELGEKLIDLLTDGPFRERLRIRARTVAAQWQAEAVAERLERFFLDRLSRL